MPQNTCNQRCSFCSYRLPDNKNSSDFDESKHIPWPEMVSLLDDLEAMGVLGIEVTGGGEPLAYPYTKELWTELATRSFSTALVTNGTLMRDRAPLITQRMKWARVSIDAANRFTYSAMRRCPERHFDLAWKAVENLREHAPDDPDFRLGIGFVLCNENIGEVYEFVARASESGADNVRLSVTFSDDGAAFFEDQDALACAVADSERAVADFATDDFRVNNLIPQRHWEVHHPEQDYGPCYTKDLLCVVEGECKVYTCCTFTGSLQGLYGKFTEHPGGFRGLWESSTAWRRTFDASEYCKCACLYRDRNLQMIALVKTDVEPEHDGLHREFI